jgi:crotonobetaine/carnitine-CoA ligase
MTTPRVLGELIEDRVKRNGDKTFLRFKDRNFSYEEINRFSNRCAHAFQNLGIRKGDKVSIMLPNCPEFLYIWFGLAKIGAVEVPVNTSYKGEFLRHIVDQSDSKVFVIAEEFLGRLRLIEDSLNKLEKVVVFGTLQRQEKGEYKIPMMSFDELFDSSDGPVDVEVYPWDPVSIIYTSGTTGLSKGALGSHNFWIVCSEKMLEYRDGKKEDIYLTFLPLYHFNAQVLTTLIVLIAEAQMVLLDRFSASRFWDEIRYYRATQVQLSWSGHADSRQAGSRIMTSTIRPHCTPAGCPRPSWKRWKRFASSAWKVWDDGDRYPDSRQGGRQEARFLWKADGHL